MKTINIKENQKSVIDRRIISDDEGNAIYNKLEQQGKIATITFPSPKTNDNWILSGENWAGHIPINNDLQIIINPKAKIENIFDMLNVAYRLPKKSFKTYKGTSFCDSLSNMCSGLAKYLSHQIISLAKQGLLKRYKTKYRDTNFISGRILFRESLKKPWTPDLCCSIRAQDFDNKDNQILLYALNRITSSKICNDDSKQIATRAFRALIGAISFKEITEYDLSKISYSQTNNHYKQLHNISKFFIAGTSPTHHAGQSPSLPFAIYMPRLFELYIAETIKNSLPDSWNIRLQERISTNEKGGRIYIDIAIINPNNKPHCIIDTKYKSKPSKQDIYQANAYADAFHCSKALLIYPSNNQNRTESFGNNTIKTAGFPLDCPSHQSTLSMIDTILNW